jgi:eukaryotic-like serine/threonine-protein kinase
MGAVFEAEHLDAGTRVALKILHPAQAAKSTSVQRFQHEARVAGSLGHPNICQVFDAGHLESGAPYLVMESLHGETLARRLAREGTLPVRDAISIVSQLLAALEAAHAKAVVHRDVKPDNLFLVEGFSLQVKLLDFGISKMSEGEALDLTRTGMVMGTPFYMAPEQARGDRTVDPRSDLYAAGVILYECISGRRPFLGANYNALLLQILSGKYPSLRVLKPHVSPEIASLVETAMAKSPDDRYQSAGAFRAALDMVTTLLDRPLPSTRAVPVPVTYKDSDRGDFVGDDEPTDVAPPRHFPGHGPPPTSSPRPRVESTSRSRPLTAAEAEDIVRAARERAEVIKKNISSLPPRPKKRS